MNSQQLAKIALDMVNSVNIKAQDARAVVQVQAFLEAVVKGELAVVPSNSGNVPAP